MFRNVANLSSGSCSIIVKSFSRMFIGLKSLFVGYYITINTIKKPGEYNSPGFQSFTIHRNTIILCNYRQQMLVQLHRLQTTINPRNCPIVLLNLLLILSLPPQIPSNLLLRFLCQSLLQIIAGLTVFLQNIISLLLGQRQQMLFQGLVDSLAESLPNSSRYFRLKI